MTPSSPDHEFLDADEWQSWGALLMLHRTALQELDTQLRQQHRLSVTEFDVLITLFNAADRRLLMSQLAERVMLSPAGATHLVTRLERDGLVRRDVDPTDGRRMFAVLTDEGDSALRRARLTHNEVLRRTFLAATTPADRQRLSRLWSRLSAQAGPDS